MILCIPDKLELCISCILKTNKIIALFWNSGDDSTCMNLCHQGVLAKAEGLLIHLPPPPSIHPEHGSQSFQRVPREIACNLQAPRESSCLLQGWLSFKFKRKALTQKPSQLAEVEENRPQAASSDPINWALPGLWFISRPKNGKSLLHKLRI